MTLNDTYNFELDSSLGDSLGKNAFNALGNAAVASQNVGVISGYDIDIKVEDKNKVCDLKNGVSGLLLISLALYNF